MFDKKFAVLLTTIHAWMMAFFAGAGILFAISEASKFYDFAIGLGFFIGVILVGFIYLSIWYLIIFLIRKSILK